MTYRRILITGGAGFIGSHLAEALLDRGHSVTIIDNLSTGSCSNLDHLEATGRLRLVVASASDAALIDREVQRHSFVYHLASAVGVKLVIERPVETVENIYHSTATVLGACSRYRRPFLITSTSEVYGRLDQVPFKEDSDVVMGATCKRRWAYACAKALDEFLTLAHHYETHLPVYIVRLFNTVGPRQTGRYGMVLPNLLEQALSGRAMTVYGDGTQRRCFCSVHDVVQALIRFPECPQAEGKVINIGTQEEVSILQLAHRIRALTGSKSEISLIPYAQAYGPGFDDMSRRVPDIRRAFDLLGWQPVRTLDDILIEMSSTLSDSVPVTAHSDNHQSHTVTSIA